jgi:hypothetical protein
MENTQVINKLLEVINLYQMLLKGNTDEENNEIIELLNNITNKLEVCFYNKILSKVKEYKEQEKDV